MPAVVTLILFVVIAGATIIFVAWALGRLPCLLGCPARTQATSKARFAFDGVDNMCYDSDLPGSRGRRGWREALIPRDGKMKLINID